MCSFFLGNTRLLQIVFRLKKSQFHFVQGIQNPETFSTVRLRVFVHF